jgi:hypothetical protein
MGMPLRTTVAALLLTTAAAAAAATTTTQGPDATTMTHRTHAHTSEGTWTLAQSDAGRMQLNLQLGGSSWGRSVDRAELAGLTDAQIDADASTPVAFRLEREAGVFEMEGTFQEGRGTGRVRFRPNGSFASALRAAGVSDAGRLGDRELMVLALTDASSARVRELAALGVQPRDVAELMKLSTHDVTPEFVRAMRERGLTGANTVDDVVRLRSHRVSLEYIGEMESLGYRDLSRDQLLQMAVHGVDAGEVRELRALGLENLTPRQLVELRIHGVTPAFVRQAREAGARDLSPEALVQMKIHGTGAGRGGRSRTRA